MQCLQKEGEGSLTTKEGEHKRESASSETNGQRKRQRSLQIFTEEQQPSHN
jgi:hypothetical protein